ncbi:hypothetical protein H6F61_24310 [Cyanobacteria bacterium FACHB-472]|nr:hypothetical protein [Cyanobacteria bacterium FACHB-472]
MSQTRWEIVNGRPLLYYEMRSLQALLQADCDCRVSATMSACHPIK